MYFVNCKRIPQQAKIRFAAESAPLLFYLIFSAVLDSTDKYLKHCIAQNCSKNRQFFGNPQENMWKPEPVWGIHDQITKYVFSKFMLSQNPQL